MLSAFLLLLAVVFAGGYGPSTPQSASTGPSQSSRTDLGAGGHRSVPVVSTQQLLAAEAEDDEASPPHGGKSKAFLPAEEFERARFSFAADDAPEAIERLPSIAVSPYEARAPPARS